MPMLNKKYLVFLILLLSITAGCVAKTTQRPSADLQLISKI